MLAAFAAAGIFPQAHAADPARITVTGVSTAALDYNGLFQMVDHTWGRIEGSGSGEAVLSVPLDEPRYYTLARNLLCLSPGDDLTVALDPQYPERSVITGRGASLNNYLKHRIYVKGGSYLSAGRNARPTLAATLPLLDSMAAARRAVLEAVECSDELRRRELARIDGDYLNSLVYYPNYNPAIFGGGRITREEYQARIAEYFADLKPITDPLLANLQGDDSLLDIESVRFVLYQFAAMAGRDELMSLWMRTVQEVGRHMQAISGDMTMREFTAAEEYGRGITNEQLRTMFEAKLAASRQFVRGNETIDITVTTLDGVVQKLSDLKGTPLYIDVWATWCGPCLAESPYFEALGKRYPGIKFVSISTDEKREVWHKFKTARGVHDSIVELWAGREVTQKWDIEAIPRFVLIDADFEIVTLDAPRPSQTERITPLLDKLSRK